MTQTNNPLGTTVQKVLQKIKDLAGAGRADNIESKADYVARKLGVKEDSTLDRYTCETDRVVFCTVDESVIGDWDIRAHKDNPYLTSARFVRNERTERVSTTVDARQDGKLQTVFKVNYFDGNPTGNAVFLPGKWEEELEEVYQIAINGTARTERQIELMSQIDFFNIQSRRGYSTSCGL